MQNGNGDTPASRGEVVVPLADRSILKCKLKEALEDALAKDAIPHQNVRECRRLLLQSDELCAASCRKVAEALAVLGPTTGVAYFSRGQMAQGGTQVCKVEGTRCLDESLRELCDWPRQQGSDCESC